MRTTTVVWAADPSISQGEQEAQSQINHEEIHTAAETLAGITYREIITQEMNEGKKELTVTRSWPDLSTAEAWVELVLSKGAKSAQVNPE